MSVRAGPLDAMFVPCTFYLEAPIRWGVLEWMTMTLSLTYLPPSALKPDPNNARTHSARQVEQICARGPCCITAA